MLSRSLQLEQLENEVDKAYAQRVGDMTAADYERESGYGPQLQRMVIYSRAVRYALAEEINGELDQMSTTLKDIITKVNASHTKAADSDNPVTCVSFCNRN